MACRDFKRELITIHKHKTRTSKTLPMCSVLLQSLAPGVGNALVFRKADGSVYPDEGRHMSEVSFREERGMQA